MSTTLRTSRTTRGTSGTVMATITVQMLARVSEMRANREKNGGDRHEPIHDPHDECVEDADEAGDESERQTDAGGERRHDEADDERHPRAVDRAGKDVAAEMVRAEPVLGRWWLEAGQGIELLRVKRGDQRRRDRQEDRQREDKEPERHRWVATQPAEREGAALRPGGDIGLGCGDGHQ